MTSPHDNAAAQPPDTAGGQPGQHDEALAELARRRSQVKEAMGQLRDALSTVPVDPDRWLTMVSERVAALRSAFDHHVEIHEGADSFLSGIHLNSPNLVPQVSKLHREHGQLDALITEASALIDSARDQSSAAVEDVRRRCDELLSHFEQHRRRGSQLVWDAFNRDLGGEH